jgi:hypothetical protein
MYWATDTQKHGMAVATHQSGDEALAADNVLGHVRRLELGQVQESKARAVHHGRVLAAQQVSQRLEYK